jgi:hypothetical protein
MIKTSKVFLVKALNDLIDRAISHGGDRGSAYYSDYENLQPYIDKVLDLLGLSKTYQSSPSEYGDDGFIISKECYAEEELNEFDFIAHIQKDLVKLQSETCYQRNNPSYYEEVEYYNLFHRLIPKSLLLSSCYYAFVQSYIIENESLFDAITKFIKEYEDEKRK